MLVIRCDYCRDRLEAQDAESLCLLIKSHVAQEHHAQAFNDEQARKVTAANSYGIEYKEVYPDSDGPDAQFRPEPYQRVRSLESREARIGMKVKVAEFHRVLEQRGMVGRVVGRYGREEYVAVGVRFSDGQHRLFWPGDLEEITSPHPWWRSLLGKRSAD